MDQVVDATWPQVPTDIKIQVDYMRHAIDDNEDFAAKRRLSNGIVNVIFNQASTIQPNLSFNETIKAAQRVIALAESKHLALADNMARVNLTLAMTLAAKNMTEAATLETANPNKAAMLNIGADKMNKLAASLSK